LDESCVGGLTWLARGIEGKKRGVCVYGEGGGGLKVLVLRP
jgi:hypothetical protein